MICKKTYDVEFDFDAYELIEDFKDEFAILPEQKVFTRYYEKQGLFVISTDKDSL